MGRVGCEGWDMKEGEAGWRNPSSITAGMVGKAHTYAPPRPSGVEPLIRRRARLAHHRHHH